MLAAVTVVAVPLPRAAAGEAGGGVPPFRRDRLPLSVDTQRELSGALTRLAARPPEGVDPQRHAIRALALALAVDPVNPEAGRLLEEVLSGAVPASPQGEVDLDSCREILAHLGDAGAGEALAACLADLIASPDPAAISATGGAAHWAGWLPELPAPPAPEAEEEEAPVRPLLAKTSVTTVALAAGEESAPAVPVPVRVSLEMDAAPGSPAFQLTFPEGAGPTAGGSERLLASARLRFGELPPATLGVVGVDAGGSTLAAGNAAEIEAATAVLLDSAFRGRPATAVVLAGLKDGALTLPEGTWARLRALEESADQPEIPERLVLPVAAAPLLHGLLAFEKAEFFLRFEVLLAGSPEELTSLATADSDPDFLAVQRRVRGRDGWSSLAQAAVRQRLGEFVQASPQHASARMLALQASGSRPTKLTRPLLAAELLRAVAPAEALGPDVEVSSLTRLELARSAQDAHRKARAAVDALERYADFGDRELLAKVRAMVDELRPLSRRLAGDSTLVGSAAHRSFAGTFRAVRHELRRAAAEPAR